MDQEADPDTGLLQVDNRMEYVCCPHDDIWYKFEEPSEANLGIGSGPKGWVRIQREPRSLNGFVCGGTADERGVLVVCTDPVCIEAFEKAGQAISRNTASGDNNTASGDNA